MNKKLVNFTVFVADFGYFVDIFDLSLFGILRVYSLRDLGYGDPTKIESFLNSLGILGNLLKNMGFKIGMLVRWY